MSVTVLHGSDVVGGAGLLSLTANWLMLVVHTDQAMAGVARLCELICSRCTTAKAGRRAISTYSRHIERKVPLWTAALGKIGPGLLVIGPVR